MSLERTYKGSLKSRNFIYQYLNPNIISKNGNKNNDKIKRINTNYNNNLFKNNYFINYSNNTKTIIKKKSNNIKSKITNFTQEKNDKEKINLIINPINTISSTRESTINSPTINSGTLTSVSKKTKNQEPFLYEPSPKNYEIKQGSIKDITNMQKYKKPENEDIRFLYKIFYNYNKSNKCNLNEQNNKNNQYNFHELRQD